MNKIITSIAALALTLAPIQAESTACWEGSMTQWPVKNVLVTTWSPMTPTYYETSGGIKALIYYSTLAHSIALTQESGSINGQKYTTITTNEMAGGLQGTQFTGQSTIPAPLLCGITTNWVKLESWLYEPGAVLWSTNFYGHASVTIRGH
jgi:hypothetical protein